MLRNTYCDAMTEDGLQLLYYDFFFFFFFFSSRRRHTRFDCDWSSDVCSSDLRRRERGRAGLGDPERRRQYRICAAGDLDRAGALLAPAGDRENRAQGIVRSEERRVGKECRSRWSPYH